MTMDCENFAHTCFHLAFYIPKLYDIKLKTDPIISTDRSEGDETRGQAILNRISRVSS